MARRILTISAALVLALLGTLLVVAYVGRADARALEGIETVDVLVATSPLTKGQTVQEAQDAGFIGTQPLPRNAVPAGALEVLEPTDAELVFASDVTTGEVLMRPRLTAAVAPSGDLVIPDGKLAVTVQLEDPARVAGMVRVGSSIAIFDTHSVPGEIVESAETAAAKATRVLLPRVEVLAVGEQTIAADTAGAASSAEPAADTAIDPAAEAVRLTMLTVAVDQAQAEKLVHGIQDDNSALYLGLLGSYEVQPGPGVNSSNLFDK